MIDVEDPPQVADEAVDDALPPDPPDGGPNDSGYDRPEPLSRRARITITVLALATAVLVALGVVYWVQVSDNAQRDDDRAAVLDLAGRQAVALTTVNPDNVKEQMELLLANSTGNFRRQFDAASPTFAKVVADGKVHSKGRVAAAGVVSLSGAKAQVLVALNSTVRNTETDKDEPRNYRLRVDLEKEADRWLVSNMQFVA